MVIKKNKWYLFGKWLEPVLSSTFWLEFKIKKLGFDFFGDIRVLHGNYFILQDDMNKVTDFVEEKIKKDKNWFKEYFKLFEVKIEKARYYAKHRDLSGFLKTLTKLLNMSMSVQLLDYGLTRYIEKISASKHIPVSEVLAQIKPYKATLLVQYQEELKKLSPKDDNVTIDEFLKKWAWVGTHIFMGTPLNRQKLFAELKNLSGPVKNKTKKKLPREYQTAIDIGSKLAFFRSFAVETADSLIYTYLKEIRDLAKKFSLSLKQILLLESREIIRLNDEGIMPSGYEKRKKGFGVVVENDKMRVITGKELKKKFEECREKIDRNIFELKGMTAHSNNKIIRGVVRLVEESKDLPKMRRGDILVANETTPDYIFGMKIAGAIITNQGGITSHAAIVSRELNKPCIIATKIATKVLHDGDLVEVDADRGIVKIL